MATNKDFIVKNGLSVGEDISVSGSVTSNLQFDDDIKAQFGDNSDLQIYSDDAHSYIQESSTQGLRITSDNAVAIRKHDDENIALFNVDGAVRLYHDSFEKFSTSSTGINVTGNAVLTGELRGPASFVIDPAAIGDNTGEVVIKGDLTVEGTTTTINSTTLTVDDKNIVLGSGSANAAAADGAGISVDITGVTNPEWNWYVNSVNTGVSAWESNYPVVITQASTGRTTNLHLVNETSAASTEVALEMSVISPANDACDVRLVAHRKGANAGSDFYIETTNSSNAIERHFTILEDGNVGIGIDSPTVALDVSGDITATGTITGADFSGITMGGSLSGSHDDAKVQYGNNFSGTPAQGHFFFDALNQKLKVYTGSAFVDAVPAGGGGGGGSGSSDATATFRKYTYTLTGTTNAISGKEDDEVTTGDFISGRLYEITTVGDTNFTSIGASSNTVGVQFTATDVGDGTTGKAKEVLFYTTGGTQNIEVYVNGVKAVEGSSNDYVATTGTSVTFTSNLVSGDVVDIQVYELLTNDSYYLKTETYTQTEVNSQIATGTSVYLPLAGGTMTGNLNVGSGGANALFTAYGGAAARPTFIHSSGYGGLQLAGTGAGSGPSLIFSNNWTNGVSEEYSILLDGANDDLVFISGDPADIASQERMRLTDDGKLGIGTSPNTALHVDPGYVTLGTSSGTDNSWINNVEDGNLELVNEGRSTDSGAVRINRKNNPSGDTTYFRDTVIYDGKSHVIVFVDGSEDKVGIGTDSPISMLHVRDSAQAGAQHTYIYDGTSVTVEATEPSVQLVAEDSGTHGGSYLWRYGNNTFAAIANPTDDTIDFTYGVSTANDFQVHAGTNMSSYIKAMTIGSDGDVSIARNFLPMSTSQDIGSSAAPWRNIYTQDLVLSNEKRETGNEVDGTKGNWTIQEGEEHLYIINNKSGKKYKFALEEIE